MPGMNYRPVDGDRGDSGTPPRAVDVRPGNAPAGVAEPSDLVPLEELAADDHALDLRGSLADQQQRRVAVEPLDLVLLRVTVAAVDPESLLHDLLAGRRSEQLRHACLEVRALAGVLHAGGLEREQARGLDLRGHVGELELDRLVLGDRLAERLALLRVAQAQLERALRDADAAGGDVDPADLERVHHLGEALAEAGVLAAEDHPGGALVAVEDQLCRLDALVAHLLDLGRHVEARVVAGVLRRARLLLADEAGHALVGRIGVAVGLGEQEHQAGQQAVGDPHLLAVDLVVLAALDGGGLDRLHVGAQLGLGEAEGGPDLARGHARQQALLLLVGAELHQQVGADEVRVDDARDRDPAARELLDDHRVGRQVEPHPAVLLGDRDPEQAELLHLVDDRAGELVGRVVVLGLRDDLLVDELPDHLDDGLLLVGLLVERLGYGHGFSVPRAFGEGRAEDIGAGRLVAVRVVPLALRVAVAIARGAAAAGGAAAGGRDLVVALRLAAAVPLGLGVAVAIGLAVALRLAVAVALAVPVAVPAAAAVARAARFGGRHEAGGLGGVAGVGGRR